MRAHGPLIVLPEKQNRRQRLLFALMTIVAWAFWIYLWLPLATAVLWIIGVKWAYTQVFRGARGVEVHTVGICLVVCGFVVLSWATYNRILSLRFQRRRNTLHIPHQDVAAHFGIFDSETVSRLTSEKCLYLHFDASGRLVDAVHVPQAGDEVAR
jgi:biofilm PGA synthesis protein PgaD